MYHKNSLTIQSWRNAICWFEKRHLLVYVILFSFHVFIAISATNINIDESALLALKTHVTHDPVNILSTNWTSITPVCNWIGVTCSNRHERVTALNISFMDLTGTIPPEIGNLSFLVELRMRNNSFHGSLPVELTRLRRLKYLHIGFNKFGGEIPPWFGFFPKLETLILFGNGISGSIPKTLSNVSSLRIVDLSHNVLEGNIPKEIGNLANLEMISLRNNLISGSIPSTMFNMSSLITLDFSYNNLSGSLPDDLCQILHNLEEMLLNHNMLVGSIPSSLWKCRELSVVHIAYNRLGGSIPRNIGNMTMLKSLYLSSNNFRGEIPSEIGKLDSLEVLAIEFASLSGQIPASVFNISTLKQLTFYSNELSGSLPVDMWYRLPALQLLDLQYNHLSGNIPRGIGNSTFLQSFGLSFNGLTGSIPEEIGELHNLVQVGLAINNLTGPIPSKLFNSSTLMYLSLAANQLSGSLLSNLGLNLPNLQLLYLGGNKLRGTIPSSITNASMLTVLDLPGNYFTGFIPNTFGNLRNLQWLNLGKNNMTVEPSSTPGWSFLNSLTNCIQLQKLVLSFNPLNDILPISIGNLSNSLYLFKASNCNIMGSIPKEIGNLNNLYELSLNGNALNGSIPTTVGGLGYLQHLGLNDNSLHGPIPEELCHLTNLSELSLSRNQLSGSIPGCFGILASLRKLSLESNNLTSTIPTTLWNLGDLLVLNLSSNFLSGNIPLQIEKFKVMTSLDLSRNQFLGNIPNTIGGLQHLSKLSLAHNRLQGSIPQSLGNINSLEFLDLSENNLSGEIPKSLKTLVYLKYMNLSYNRLHGEIPAEGAFANFTAQSFMMNDALCSSQKLLHLPPCHVNAQQGKKSKLYLLKYVLPVIASSTFILTCIFAFIRFQRKRKTIPPQTDLIPIPLQTRISHHELLLATTGLDESNLIGKGSFGSVYKGILFDGTIVACKVFNLEVEAAFKSFDVECEVMRSIRHRNIGKIISSCSNIDIKALVLEYVPNGSLEKWLYSHNNYLNIEQRMNIMIDIASALEYLHHDFSTSIVHCDLKPSNVLLDEEMVAHVGDFGIAKLLGQGASTIQTATLATIGYTAPEHGADGIVSTSGDVYSYGIMLMEILTRKKPTDDMFDGDKSLKNWVRDSLNGSLIEVVDSNLLREEEKQFVVKEECLYSILTLAMDCARDLPEERVNMKNIVTRLKKIKHKFLSFSL